MKFGLFKHLFKKSKNNEADPFEVIINEFPKELKNKIVEPREALEIIKSGDRVYVCTACASSSDLAY